ncbi:thioredoxin family protein [Paenibacillus sp. JX-17]|uniref:Thioredoxin family protein n=1 Tax=Paenibacillus lacisoli TaxID=3064525 RepID=A0ABT9C8C0_9BACL|nr:thioredoxin family protein [Paenibacillus sp. JX-17]MDO7904929.1 thioredoxin family protein [Paenibacillus sp. JX-17]
MIELEARELKRMIWEGYRLALFVYTPMCGTCAAARRMLEVAEQLVPENTLYSVNINRIPEQVQEYRISSVPALLLFDGEAAEPKAVYKMGSVEHLLNEIRSVIS